MSAPGSVREVALLALKLGLTAFGGPAVHIAMLRDEVVTRRKWVTDAHFLDLLGVTNLIPGPNSTEMVMHIGHLRAGWRGLIAAGVCFIAPAMLIVLALAWAYVRYGTTPAAESLLYGVKPVIIAVVAQAIWGLAKNAVKDTLLALVAGLSFAGYLFGINELLIVAIGGLAVWLARAIRHGASGAGLSVLLPLGLPAITTVAAQAVPVTLWGLFLIFLKIGSVLYGSGYVLLAFMRGDLVQRLGWLTDKQLLDAVTVGQFTPGPVFTTATFVGFLIGSWPGAILATVGIFLPAFIFVAAVNPLIARMRASPTLAALLDGVNVASLGLMLAVAWQLARAAIIDLPTALIALAAAFVLIRFKVNSAWLVLAGALLGAALMFAFGAAGFHLLF